MTAQASKGLKQYFIFVSFKIFV